MPATCLKAFGPVVLVFKSVVVGRMDEVLFPNISNIKLFGPCQEKKILGWYLVASNASHMFESFWFCGPGIQVCGGGGMDEVLFSKYF